MNGSSNRGQLSLDLIIALLVFVVLFSGLFVFTTQLSDEAISTNMTVQKRLVANQIAQQLSLSSSVPVDSNWDFFTPPIRDLNNNALHLYCGIRVENVSPSGNFSINVTYPGFVGKPVTAFSYANELTLSVSPVSLPCGCVNIKRTDSSHVAISTCN